MLRLIDSYFLYENGPIGCSLKILDVTWILRASELFDQTSIFLREVAILLHELLLVRAQAQVVENQREVGQKELAVANQMNSLAGFAVLHGSQDDLKEKVNTVQRR